MNQRHSSFAVSHFLSHLVSLLLNLLDVANHVECHFWEVIVLTLHDALETIDGVWELYVLACSCTMMSDFMLSMLLQKDATRCVTLTTNVTTGVCWT